MHFPQRNGSECVAKRERERKRSHKNNQPSRKKERKWKEKKKNGDEKGIRTLALSDWCLKPAP